MLVRPAAVNDFLSIAELDRRAWVSNARGEFIPDGEHVWRVWCEHALVFGAWDGLTLVGVALAFPCVDGKYCLHKLFVDQARRGEGVGAKLMAALGEAIDQLGVSAFLTVDPANAVAVALYEKFGFTEREFVDGYYRTEEPRLVLTRPARPLGV